MIYLRLLQESDLPERVKWMNNSLVYSSMGFKPPISLQNTFIWFINNKNNKNRVDCSFVNERGDILAMAGLTKINYSLKNAELYVFVNPDLQGQGIGHKVTYLLCKYAFLTLHLSKVYLYTNKTNIKAQRVYEKIGFVLEAIVKEGCILNGEYKDRLYYELSNNDLNYEWLPLLTIGETPLIIDQIKWEGLEIKLVRDDLFPAIGGGSKARKAVAFEAFLKYNNFDAVVTCGGVQSNHNRAIALMCSRNGWKCHLCIQGSEERFIKEKGNAGLVKLSTAECEFILPEETSAAMNQAMDQLRQEGFNPYYIVGGGHNIPGGTCFVDAIKELKRQCDQIGYKPDYIFLASGTGSTQAGIVVGLDLVGWNDVKCIGISVARQKNRGKQIIVEFANMLAAYYGVERDYSDKIDFTDDYLCGGYEKISLELEEYIKNVMAHTGLIFDTTYSGKGFYGMMQEIQKLNICNKNIIFWHTGGLMNLMN